MLDIYFFIGYGAMAWLDGSTMEVIIQKENIKKLYKFFDNSSWSVGDERTYLRCLPLKF